MYLPHLKDLIIRVLKEYNLYSESAVVLLLGTCAQESRFGRYLRQLGSGPALSIFQIEPATFEYLKKKYSSRFDLEKIYFAELEYNLKFAILFCRLKYLSIPVPLPEPQNIGIMAEYWKRYYNTNQGSGKISEFISNYKLYCEKV